MVSLPFLSVEFLNFDYFMLECDVGVVQYLLGQICCCILLIWVHRHILSLWVASTSTRSTSVRVSVAMALICHCVWGGGGQKNLRS
jgi:hypothetical protein